MKTLKSTYYNTLLKRFDTYIVATKSIKSGNYYTGNVADFLEYLESIEIWDLNKVEEQTMKAYFGVLSTRKKQRGKGILCTSTINMNLSTLRMFSLRMQQDGILRRGFPVPCNFKIQDTSKNSFSLKRAVLTSSEIKLIYKHCNSTIEQSLIALAYGCGLRRSALVDLEDNAINYQKGVVTVLKSKNNKTRQVPISDFFLIPLRNYNVERIRIMREYRRSEKQFFLHSDARPYSGNNLNQLLKKIIARTKSEDLLKKNITLHCLRHSIATHLMDAGQSYEYVREFLGHSMVDTTTIYARNRKIKNYYTL